MKILRYHHNKLDHKAVLHHGQVLSLQTDLSVSEVLSLPISERNYLEGQSGKYLKAPLGMYPLSAPLSAEELSALRVDADQISTNLIGSGSSFSVSSAASARAEVVDVQDTSGNLAGHSILLSVVEGGSPQASVLGPWITTIDELEPGASLDVSVSVNGSPGSLDSLQAGDSILIEVPALGQLSLNLG